MSNTALKELIERLTAETILELNKQEGGGEFAIIIADIYPTVLEKMLTTFGNVQATTKEELCRVNGKLITAVLGLLSFNILSLIQISKDPAYFNNIVEQSLADIFNKKR